MVQYWVEIPCVQICCERAASLTPPNPQRIRLNPVSQHRTTSRSELCSWRQDFVRRIMNAPCELVGLSQKVVVIYVNDYIICDMLWLLRNLRSWNQMWQWETHFVVVVSAPQLMSFVGTGSRPSPLGIVALRIEPMCSMFVMSPRQNLLW